MSNSGKLFSFIAVFGFVMLSSFSLAVEPEGSIAAAKVLPGAVVLDYAAPAEETLSGFFVRLANCIGPRETPVVVGLRVRGELFDGTARNPRVSHPLVHWTRSGGNAVLIGGPEPD